MWDQNKVYVHVIKASGIKFQLDWKKGTSDTRILSDLNASKVMFGYNGTVKGPDPSGAMLGDKPVIVNIGDPKTGFAYDQPSTIVAVIDPETGAELRRLKGPPTLDNTMLSSQGASNDSPDPMAARAGTAT